MKLQSNADYHADTNFLSSSAIKLLLKDAAEYERQYIKGERDSSDKPHFTEGSAVHSLILEPDKFATDYAIYPGLRKAGKEYDAFKETVTAGQSILSAPQLIRCEKLAKAALSMDVAIKLLAGSLSEHTMTSMLLDVPVKARADAIVPGKHILDVKTTSMPSSADIFRNTVSEFSYDLSASLYKAVADSRYNANHDWYWLVLSKADWQCHVYKASIETLAKGTSLLTKGIVKYKSCKAAGKWADDITAVNYDTRNYEIKLI